MSAQRSNPATLLPGRLSLAFAACGLVMGSVVLLGWHLDLDILTTLGFSNTIFMTPNTALCLVLGSLAVVLLQVKNRFSGIIARLLGMIVFLFAAATTLEHLTGRNFGIDDVFMRARLQDWTVTPTPGRFAVQTSIAFTAIGAAIVCSEFGIRRFRFIEAFSAIGLLMGFLGLLGHAYGARSLYGVMAVHTAASVAIVSLAILLARPRHGIVGLFFSNTAGGIALRRTLLSTVVALTLFGWVRVRLQYAGYTNLEGGTAVLVVASILFVCGVLIRASLKLQLLEQERETARQALFESEARYRSIFEYSKEGIALYEPILDDKGNVIDWLIRDANASFISGAGRDRVHVVGHRLREVFGEREGMQNYLAAATEVYQTGKARQFEAYFGPLGRYFIASIFPISGDQFASTTIDVTKSKQAEQLVRESEARYRQIVETATEGIWLLDENMRITFVNERIAALLGYEPREMIGHRKFDFVFEEDAHFIQSLFDSRRTGARAVVDVRFRHRDGTERWMMMSAAPILDSKGTFRGALDMFTDITERRATVQALRTSEARFRELADSMPQMVWTAEADGTCTYANRRYVEYAGNPGAWTDLLDADDTPNIMRHWGNALMTGQEFAAECQLRRVSDGAYRWHLVRAVPSLDQHGRVSRWYGTCTDIHENKLAEEAMMKSEKLAATGRLAATIAHEINNPLEAVTNLVFLAQNTAGAEQSREFLAMATEELQRVAHITKQTLGFYRETAAPGPVRVSTVIDSVVSLYERKIQSKDISVEKLFSTDVNIEGIPGEIRQVFSNLISNAIDALEPGGVLKLRTHAIRSGSSFLGMRISVVDNGVGIPADIRDQVFEPFFTTKRDFGTGLGLWVTRQIVRRHGGNIRVRSCTRSPHRGTHFSVFLPAKSELALPENKLNAATA